MLMGPHSLTLLNNQLFPPLISSLKTSKRIPMVKTSVATTAEPKLASMRDVVDVVNAPSTIFPPRHRQTATQKGKVVVVVGATGTGKSRLAIELASSPTVAGEVVNSDKMQFYNGLDVVTNKVTDEETYGVPHHLIGFLDPEEDFTVSDFRSRATAAIAAVQSRGNVPVIAGGSNTYIEKLVDDASFRSRFDCCFLWVDVRLNVLDRFLSERVDRMVAGGLVDEVRQLFDPLDGDYSRGVRRAIGVPEMDAYLRLEAEEGPESPAAKDMLELGIAQVKVNTSELVRRQLKKIHRMRKLPGWHLHRLDATEALWRRCRGLEGGVAWSRHVAAPASDIVRSFLEVENERGRRISVASILPAQRSCTSYY